MLFAQGPNIGFSTQPILMVCAGDWGKADPGTSEAIRAEIRELGATLCVTPESRARTLTLFDESGNQRFRLSASARASTPETLLAVLRIARRSAIDAEPAARSGRITQSEIVVLSLIGALSLVLLDACELGAPAPASSRRPGPVSTRRKRHSTPPRAASAR